MKVLLPFHHHFWAESYNSQFEFRLDSLPKELPDFQDQYYLATHCMF